MNDYLDRLIEERVITSKKFLAVGHFVKCMAYIINLIVKSILNVLKVGVHKDMYKLFDNLENKLNVESMRCIMKIRTFSMDIKVSPQRQKESLKVDPEEHQKKCIAAGIGIRSTLHIE
jgi:hypothetical protein